MFFLMRDILSVINQDQETISNLFNGKQNTNMDFNHVVIEGVGIESNDISMNGNFLIIGLS